MTLAERLQRSLTQAGVNQSQLARQVGVRSASVNDWLSGKTKRMDAENLLKTAAFLKVRPEWLAMGKGPMRKDASASAADRELQAHEPYWPFSVDPLRYERAAADIGTIVNAVLVAQVEQWERQHRKSATLTGTAPRDADAD